MRASALAATIVIAAFAPAANAGAADLISYPTSTAQQLPLAPAAGTYDWSGFYAGVFGSYQRGSGSGDRFGLGVDAGVNTTFNFVLAGAEVAAEGLGGSAGGTASVQGLGRAGVLVTDNALLYGAAGYGLDVASPADGDVLFGGGLEYALSNEMSLRAQYLRGFPVTGADGKDKFTLGAQFHF
jgi:outer membrane immunogenic protein